MYTATENIGLKYPIDICPVSPLRTRPQNYSHLYTYQTIFFILNDAMSPTYVYIGKERADFLLSYQICINNMIHMTSKKYSLNPYFTVVLPKQMCL
ncbi:hypothetical protein GDO86_009589 [Hymenochirus boettgeri]|uniref:Uncharacterized protein n=1 Tax=Hymenochirus boettgeri TaxID=247094 RepID=A0A8T2JL59_9PIPI|nr:hypothetical protein GDO86_009589 [Hymenochirus boettgeri]